MQTRLALAVLLIGAALMAFMITVESEPGLLPIVLVLAGATWFFVARARARRR